jgi:streptomycin 6-kinase
MAGVDSLELPDGYRERLPRSWQPWLDQLPEQVESYLERWDLTVVGEFPLSYGYVVPVERADGRGCVLKVQPTHPGELGGAERELLGLRLAPSVAVGVVEEDAANGVLLLDRAEPGTTLEEMSESNDDGATQTLATVIRDYGRPLHNPGSQGLRAFEELAGAFERFDRGSHGKLAGTTIRSARHTAERVLADLLAHQIEPYLLHGDLHHGNALVDDKRGLVVVDPWGIYGDRSVDVAPALHNPIDFVARTANVDALIRRRLAIYSEVFDIESDHLVAWCYVYNVIRALWSLEDVDEVVDVNEVSDNDAGLRTVAALRKLI